MTESTRSQTGTLQLFVIGNEILDTFTMFKDSRFIVGEECISLEATIRDPDPYNGNVPFELVSITAKSNVKLDERMIIEKVNKWLSDNMSYASMIAEDWEPPLEDEND